MDTFINGYTLFGAAKAKTAVSWLGVSADSTLLYALNNSDGRLYILETRGGRGVGSLDVGDHPLSAELSKDGKTLYIANLGSASVAVIDVQERGKSTSLGFLPTGWYPT